MKSFEVEVVYALPDEQQVFALQVTQGATVCVAIEQSGVLAQYPEIDLNNQAVGIFGQIVTLETALEAGDRVEIYRPLTMDPMEARRVRAKQQKQSKK